MNSIKNKSRRMIKGLFSLLLAFIAGVLGFFRAPDLDASAATSKVRKQGCYTKIVVRKTDSTADSATYSEVGSVTVECSTTTEARDKANDQDSPVSWFMNTDRPVSVKQITTSGSGVSLSGYSGGTHNNQDNTYTNQIWFNVAVTMPAHRAYKKQSTTYATSGITALQAPTSDTADSNWGYTTASNGYSGSFNSTATRYGTNNLSHKSASGTTVTLTCYINVQTAGICQKDGEYIADHEEIGSTLYIDLAPRSVTISYDANGGTLTSSTPTSVVDGASFTLPTAPTYSGYYFTGWLCSANSKTYAASGPCTLCTTSAVKFTAQWTAATVKSTGVTSYIQVNNGSTSLGKLSIQCTTSNYLAGSTTYMSSSQNVGVTQINAENSNVVLCKADGTAIGNNNSFTTSSSTNGWIPFYIKITLPAHREYSSWSTSGGFNTGWFYPQTSSSSSYTATNLTHGSASKTVVVQCFLQLQQSGLVAYNGSFLTSGSTLTINLKSRNVTINYDANGGEDIDSATVTDGANFTLPSSANRTGFTLVGWSGNGKTYSAGATANVCSTSPVTFTAIWRNANGSFQVDNATSSTNMFYGDYNLVGGEGTVFTSEIVDAERAIIDQGEDDPGYFTDGNN